MLWGSPCSGGLVSYSKQRKLLAELSSSTYLVCRIKAGIHVSTYFSRNKGREDGQRRTDWYMKSILLFQPLNRRGHERKYGLEVGRTVTYIQTRRSTRSKNGIQLPGIWTERVYEKPFSNMYYRGNLVCEK